MDHILEGEFYMFFTNNSDRLSGVCSLNITASTWLSCEDSVQHGPKQCYDSAMPVSGIMS
jgi:hypothetical protein